MAEYFALQKHDIHNKFVFGSLHSSYAIHRASRNYTWKAGLLCVIHGVGHDMKHPRGNSRGCHHMYSSVMRPCPSHEIIQGIVYVMILAGGCNVK